ncbi:hypothetical protein GCM10017643_45330 [Ancylobacter dichloromethanicus]|uniref:Uncharacterized protein n=2 Tax=Ancylobacter dichloromethanicus TaxID=518825 RepID=A0A9W6JBC5_9HYPH|nr:hypothetical protein GCM10017643_45330 [Ancylobacter dichloromethanicus]
MSVYSVQLRQLVREAVHGNVCFQEIANPISTAEIGAHSGNHFPKWGRERLVSYRIANAV